MKFVVILITLVGSVQLSYQQSCKANIDVDVGGQPVEELLVGRANETNFECFEHLAKQVHMELLASITYLQMSADLLSATNFRPGMAKFLLESAAEERGHAKKFIEYFLMRGGNISNVALDIKSHQGIKLEPGYTQVTDTISALKLALALERKVTDNIRKIISACETTTNDYHAVDFLTGEFMTEQHEGIRKIVELLQTRSSMSVNYGALADVMFDQTLLN